jgi:hypothetical protein
MPTSFSLCPTCAAQFQSLQFDANAACRSVLLPFGSIVWADELPANPQRECPHHKECEFSLIRLFAARKQLWKTGHNEEWAQKVLSDAQQLLPHWPGFRRLSLSTEHRSALQACEEETDDFMEHIREDAAVFTLTEQGDGVVSFTAHPRPPQPEQ